jgi:large subunit ribosomal protein L33
MAKAIIARIWPGQWRRDRRNEPIIQVKWRGGTKAESGRPKAEAGESPTGLLTSVFRFPPSAPSIARRSPAILLSFPAARKFDSEFAAMAKSKKKAETVFLVCEETGDHNYTLKRKPGGEKLKLMKFSPRVRKHTLHAEKKK